MSLCAEQTTLYFPGVHGPLRWRMRSISYYFRNSSASINNVTNVNYDIYLQKMYMYYSVKIVGEPYHIPDRWRMCTISYSIPRWRTAISCSQCRSSNMFYYAEMHRQTVEKLTWLKGTYYTENPSIRFMFVTFQYYCSYYFRNSLASINNVTNVNYDIYLQKMYMYSCKVPQMLCLTRWG
jgi:hypothetical protein